MKVRLENTASATINNDPAHCFVAIELSKSSWVLGFQTPLAKQNSRYQVKVCDARALLELIERVRSCMARELGRPVEVMSCYEAGYDGFWLHRVLEAHGIHNHVLDPASLQVNRRARRPKTDRIDADRMVRALMRHLRGEPEACSVIRVPSPEQEDARRLHRERDCLIAERVAHVNRVKGLCATHGIYDYQPLRSDRLKRLEKLRTGDGRALAPRLKAEIMREIKRLEVVLEMISTVEVERDAILTEKKIDASQRRQDQNACQAESNRCGVFDDSRRRGILSRFCESTAARKLCGLGIKPILQRVARSDQGISKAGNPKARVTMIELAWT
jgi:transposase